METSISLEEIQKLVKTYHNDQELGRIIRQLFSKLKDASHSDIKEKSSN